MPEVDGPIRSDADRQSTIGGDKAILKERGNQMKKVFMSVMVVVLAVALVVGGSGAIYNTSATSPQHTFVAGYMGVAIDGSVSSAITLGNMNPCHSYTYNYSIQNTGSLPGQACWSISIDGEPAEPNTGSVDLTANQFAKLVFVDDVVFDRNGTGVYSALGPDGVSAYGLWPDGSTTVTQANWWTYSDATHTNTQARIWVLTNNVWGGAPGGIDDEWVLPDWTRWADTINGNNDGYLSVYEIATCPSWCIDDTFGATKYLDVGHTYWHQVSIHLADSYTGNWMLISDGQTVYNGSQGDGMLITLTVTLTSK